MSYKDIIISPSVLAADFKNIENGIKQIESTSAEWVHLDVMDGSFVPPISFGSQMVKSIRNITNLKLDVHLMVEHPETQIDMFEDAGADLITFHAESTVHIHKLITDIKSRGMKAGIAIVPSTPVHMLKEILSEVDLVLVMTVNPGYGGQKLIEGCVHKIEELSELRTKNNYSYLISADGGVNRETSPALLKAGLDIAVCGSSFFKADDKEKEIEAIKGNIF